MGSTGDATDGPSQEQAKAANQSWMLATTVMVLAIWLAVTLISVFAPDLVSGSEQEHLPLAAMTSWLWGVIGTAAALVTMGRLRGKVDNQPIWVGLTVVVVVLWAVTTVLAIALPVFETGSDPTQLPLAALLVPMGAAILTGVAGLIAAGFTRHQTEWE